MRRFAIAAAAFLILVPGAQAACLKRAAGPIPARYQALYKTYGGSSGVPWQLVAAVGSVETRHGADPGMLKPHDRGVLGPMQFQAGSNAAAVRVDAAGNQGFGGTWGEWRTSSGKPPYRITDPEDAIAAAAAKLANDAGAARDWRRALLRYNNLTSYVTEVLARARTYGAAIGCGTSTPPVTPPVVTPPPVDPSDPPVDGSEPPPSDGGFEDGAGMDGGSSAAADLLWNEGLVFAPRAAADLEAGIVDIRLVALLAWIGQRHTVQVSYLKTGHAKYVAGTRKISNHWYGRAASIVAVDGIAVRPGRAAAKVLWQEIARAPAALRPHELGSPWVAKVRGARTFVELGQIHVGFDGPTRL